MAGFRNRSCVYIQDKDHLIDLVRAYRVKTGVAVYPTTWRVRLLLTSRVGDPRQDACIWETPSGQMAAFAMLWRRRVTSPYRVLERFVHPSFATRELAADLLAWSSRRAEAIAGEQGSPLSLYAQEFAPSLNLESPFEAYGFTPLKPNPDENNLYFGRSLHGALPEPALPPGYSLRPVQSVQELNACQSISSFAAVSPEHQQELFESDEYSHLVAIAPGKSLAAYCECSIDRSEWQAIKASGSFIGEANKFAVGKDSGIFTGPRIGWIDYIETIPDQHGRGLGQAVLWAGLKRLQEWGAQIAMLITISTNTPALRLYTKTGFEWVEVREPVSYEKHIGKAT